MSYFVGACAGVMFIAFLFWTPNATNTPLDDTDNKLTGDRSNLHILVDHGTGCQYLTQPRGGLTPRLNLNGAPICKGPAK